MASRYRLSVWMTHGTLAAAPRGCSEIPGTELIDSHQAVQIGDLEIHPFPCPMMRASRFSSFSDGRHRLGVVTDLGSSTPHVEQMLSGCDALVLECNR
ncbi:MAG: MBL fold metallo-hydrolase [Rhodocyclaceae bacterium]|nr:MBL fold metallo-hydrolase [Rhodocyclaceae bacterium]